MIQEKMKKLSIVRIVNPFYPIGGGSVTHIIELTKHMYPYFANQLIICPIYDINCNNYDSNFIVPISRVDEKINNNKVLNKLPGFYLLNLMFFTYNAMMEVKKIIAKGNMIDLIYVHNLTCGLFLCFLSKVFSLNKPIIIMHHHGRPLYSGNIKLSGLIYNLIMLSMICLFKPDHYIQLNDGVLDKKFLRFLRLIGIKFTIVNHAIDANVYSHSIKRNKFDDFVILSPHRLDPFKSVDLTIKSFKLFRDQIQSSKPKKKAYLKIIGSGPSLNELTKLAGELEILDSIIFAGEKSQREVIDEVISSDVIVGTSLISNMNRSILEAMSCGKPVLIFGHPSEKDLFVNMKNSALVDFGDINKFADMLVLLFECDELRNHIGKNAEMSIISERNWETRINQELKICSDIFSKDLNY